jgi:hypothetical protein
MADGAEPGAVLFGTLEYAVLRLAPPLPVARITIVLLVFPPHV